MNAIDQNNVCILDLMNDQNNRSMEIIKRWVKLSNRVHCWHRLKITPTSHPTPSPKSIKLETEDAHSRNGGGGLKMSD
jgi:hypothetical protein